jgi:anti-sigma regulatory factor (Ser/Thr protein kinase)
MESDQKPVEVSDRIVLQSNLTDMERLSAWVDEIASKYRLAERVRFAVHLCLEEVVSNAIRHGYRNQDGHLVTIVCTEPHPGHCVFTVEDDATPFNPLAPPALPAIGPDPGQLGGQGIRLLRGFADTLEYEAKPGGNRLYIGFANVAAQAKT